MKILLLSRYDNLGASSRVRLFQYLPFLRSKGWRITVSPLFSDDYVRALYGGRSRLGKILSGYWQRLRVLVMVGKYDLLWIEKELFPFMPASIERLLKKNGVSVVVDYDDALFHNYDQHRFWFVRTLLGRKIDIVMQKADLVIAGNEYLAERAEKAGARQVEIIPTVVDPDRYKMVLSDGKPPLVVGWIGSPGTTKYLLEIGHVVESLIREFNVEFVAVGADAAVLGELPIKVLPWAEESEVALIQHFDVGIMPLTDSPWERGKCGYKLIQYMACGLPVLASPVGVNTEIVDHGVNGFLVRGIEEWENVLKTLLGDRLLRQEMGHKGRKVVEDWYSLQVQAPRLETLLQHCVGVD